MAELKASEVKYGAPFKVSVGSLFLTATQIELPTSAEYAEGGVELNLEKLGLTDQAVAGVQPVSGPKGETGETVSTTALPALAWCNPLVTAKTANESGVQVATCFPAVVTAVGTKLFLRIFSQETAGIGKVMIEPKTASKAAVGNTTTTVFVLGK